MIRTKKKNKRPLYIIAKKHHWCNDTAAEAVKADFFLMPSLDFIKNSRIRNILLLIPPFFYAFFLPKREVYIASSVPDLLTLKINKMLFQRESKVIQVLFSDYYSKNHKGFKRKFMNWIAGVVDAAITPGNMLKQEIKEMFDFPVEVSYHYPKNNAFYKINANTKSKDVITIGIKAGFRKGTDVFCEVANSLPNTKFYLLGDLRYLPENFIKKIKKTANLITTGVVKPEKYVKKCTFYLLPGRYDAGPISLTEAMAAGLIPIVSNRVGGQDLVRQLRKDLVINSLKPRRYYLKLKELKKLDQKELKKLSKKSKKIASQWNMKKGMVDFRKKFEKLSGLAGGKN
jgi:glycosyltransferase involved in cell wall biosynthesis